MYMQNINFAFIQISLLSSSYAMLAIKQDETMAGVELQTSNDGEWRHLNCMKWTSSALLKQKGTILIKSSRCLLEN